MRQVLALSIVFIPAMWTLVAEALDSVPPPAADDKALPSKLLKIYKNPIDDGDKTYWQKEGQSELERVLSQERNMNRAKNVILFLGDGMGISSVTAGRIYKGQQRDQKSGEEAELVFDTFPHTALSKTYCVNKQVPDSACTGTAFLCGVKTNYQVIGADARATPDDCASLSDDSKVFSIAHEAIKEGKKAGLSFKEIVSSNSQKLSYDTYCVDKQVPDSACTGTAFLCGVKTNYQVIGADARATPDDCASLSDDSKVFSIAHEAIKEGKKAGIVTSTRVTHATPAAAYAHSAHRKYECDGKITAEMRTKCPNFKDIAKQLVENEPGNKLSVIMGGGIQFLKANATNMTGDPVDPDDCRRQDNRNLMKEWLDEKNAGSAKAALVHSKSDLMELKTQELDYLMGIFANGHLPYEFEKREKSLDVPTLADMTKKAIEVLRRGDDGFFLLVEGGRIDHGHHKGIARRALDELLAFDDAIKVATEMVDLSETLIVVTADHSHVMTMNGYPSRGQDITGFAQLGDDKLPYTTLMYTNGPGFNFTADSNGSVSRVDISEEDVLSYDYKQQSAVPAESETHGGEDVAIYAIAAGLSLFSDQQ
ncbi:Alkaline phosphatase [Trinorchestia longiramus]|nr:Alkaline phosphatase [Trinorchestia longiramus]